jgi:hypothetical protein
VAGFGKRGYRGGIPDGTQQGGFYIAGKPCAGRIRIHDLHQYIAHRYLAAFSNRLNVQRKIALMGLQNMHPAGPIKWHTMFSANLFGLIIIG